MDISIVILNYKSKGFTLNCIKSIREADFGDLEREIIVVDNDSQDYIGDILKWQYPDIIFIQNGANLGMGAGNNTGIRRAKGDFLVVMNPDTIAFNDTFQRLIDYMRAHPKTGIVAPKQLNPDGSIQDSCFRWHGPLTPIYRRTFLGRLRLAQKDLQRFLMRDFSHDEERAVDWVLGSFLFLRRQALDQTGLFDDRYFMYFEDTDLCRAMHAKGWEVVYYPEARIIHNHIRQSAQEPWWRFFTNPMARTHIVSWIKYARKWRGK